MMFNSYSAFPDYLSVSFKKPFSPDLLASAFNYPVFLKRLGVRWRGYSDSSRILRGSIGGEVASGLFAFSDDTTLDTSANRGCFVSITGLGCFGFDAERFFDVLSPYSPSITRLDLAIDFYDGELTYDDVTSFYEKGFFHCHGSMPRCSSISPTYPGGDKAGGYTFYVGKPSSSKMVRAYEKNFEQHAAGRDDLLYQNWFRFEIQVRNRDYLIPIDFYKNYDGLLASLYPNLFPEKIPIPNHSKVGLSDFSENKLTYFKQQATVSIEHLKYHARQSYGGLFHVLTDFFGQTPQQIVEDLSRPVVPTRLNLPLTPPSL